MATTINGGGQSAINVTVSGDTLNLGALTQTAGSGGSVNFSTGTGTITTTTANSNGILGGWATAGTAGLNTSVVNWATNSNGSGLGNVVAYTGYTYLSSTAGTSYAGSSLSATTNYFSGSQTINGANEVTQITGTGTFTINSLVQQGDFSIPAGGTLVLASGGLIMNGQSRWLTQNNTGATGGTSYLTTGLASGELFVDNSWTPGTGNWTIWPYIVNNGSTPLTLVKTGPGQLDLGNFDTYTGGTVVDAGTLDLIEGSGTGNVRGTISVNPGATLLLGANNALGYTAGVCVTTVYINGGTMTSAGGGNATDQGYFTSFVLTGGTVNYSGTAANDAINFDGSTYGITSMASSTASTWSVPITLRASGTSMFITTAAGTTSGGIDLNISGAINGSAGIIKNGAGTLELSGANTYNGTTTINGGTIQVGNGSAGSLTSGALTFGGTSTVNFDEANASAQAMGALTFSAGDGTVGSTYGTSGTTTLTFASLATRTAGATGNFVTSGGTVGTPGTPGSNIINFSTSPGSGFISQGDFFNGSNYAYYDTTSSPAFLRGLVYGTDSGAVTATGTSGITSGTTTNVELTGNVTAQTTASINTLNMGANSLALASGGAFRPMAFWCRAIPRPRSAAARASLPPPAPANWSSAPIWPPIR